MKKVILSIVLVLALALTFTGCSDSAYNRTIIDTTYNFNTAIIKLPDGSIITGKVESWLDYDGEQLQIKINGKTYLVSNVNAVLIKE